LEWDSDNERFIPAASELKFDDDLSTQSREHLWDIHHLGPEAVLNNDTDYSLVGEWQVDAVRKLKFSVRSSPDLTIDGPLGCSHVSIDWPTDSIIPPAIVPSKTARKKLRADLTREMTWAYGQVKTTRPDGSLQINR
jgi:hypothetical protein